MYSRIPGPTEMWDGESGDYDGVQGVREAKLQDGEKEGHGSKCSEGSMRCTAEFLEPRCKTPRLGSLSHRGESSSSSIYWGVIVPSTVALTERGVKVPTTILYLLAGGHSPDHANHQLFFFFLFQSSSVCRTW